MTFRHGKNLFAFLMAATMWAQPGVNLKTAVSTPNDQRQASVAMPKRLGSDSWHMLLVFPQTPGQTEVGLLQARGVSVSQLVPERGLMATVPDSANLDDVRLDWFGRLRPEQKISPLLVDEGLLSATDSDPSEMDVLVEFYGDVDRASMLAIAGTEKVAIRENPDLVSWQLLVHGRAAVLAHLAEWDEVAYLFPVSRELSTGTAVVACGGAQTGMGTIGQLVAKVSEGWDGAGKGSADLGYFFSSYTGRLTQEQVRGEVLRAMAEWSRYVKVRFLPSQAAEAPHSINVMFATGDHGDGYPFDGPGKTLAHTFYPNPPNPDPIAGDLHLDDDEQWQLGTNVDLYSVVLHELGHALGLGHSDNPASVMYPYYRRVAELNSEDIDAIRGIYAASDGTLQPTAPATPALQIAITNPATLIATTQQATFNLGGTTAGGTGNIAVTWSSSRGGSGTATGFRPWTISNIALLSGDNLITVTATDASQAKVMQQIRITRDVPVTPTPTPTPTPAPTPTAVAIHILTPVSTGIYTSATGSVVLTGTADGAITRIAWVNSRGNGGASNAGSNWTTSPIALETGTNRITVTGFTASGQSASASIDITYNTPAPPTGPPDTQAPGLIILTPQTTVSTTSTTVATITGTASDNIAVAYVDWVGSGSSGGRATGTTSWRIDNIPLLPGANSFMIRVFDTAGNMTWRSLLITRQ